MIARRMRGPLLLSLVALFFLATAGTAFAIPPFVNFSIDATGNTSPSGASATAANGWFNVPITLNFVDIVWDDPLHAGHYGISGITWTRDGGLAQSVVPTSTLTLEDEGVYTVSCQGSWGFYAYPIVVGIDHSAPVSSLQVLATDSKANARINVSDTVSGPAYVTYAVDGAAEASAPVGPADPVLRLDVPAGAHDLHWLATDAAGNSEAAWHDATVTITPKPALVLGRPVLRTFRGRVALSGRMSGPVTSGRVTLVFERRAAGRWRRYQRMQVEVGRGAKTWKSRRIALRRGRYRVTAVAAPAAVSPTAYFTH